MFRWYTEGQPISDIVRIQLCHGDAYVMSHWAVGVKWKSPTLVTLRHAAGAPTCSYSKPAVAKKQVRLVEPKQEKKREREEES